MPTLTRIERDLLGELAIEADALYGIHTARAVAALTFSGRTLGRYPAYLRALATVKKAAAAANQVAGVLEPRIGTAIQAACDLLIAGGHRDQFPVDLLAGGGSIGVNMNINEVIANLANESLGGRRGGYEPIHPKHHVNASQSTADVCHTATRLALLMLWDDLGPRLAACADALRVKAIELAPVATISRTCLQDGLPVSMGDLFGGYVALIARRTDAAHNSVAALHQINLGGTVVGSGEGAPAAYRNAIMTALCRLSGRDLVLRDNLFDAAQNIDDLAAASSALALIAEALMKIAQDLRLLSSGPEGGFGELILPAVQEGSSFFPAKINPAVPETLLHCCFQVLAADRAVHLALERGELNLNVFEGSAAANLFDVFEMLTNAVPRFVEGCLNGLTANTERCRALAARGRAPTRRAPA